MDAGVARIEFERHMEGADGWQQIGEGKRIKFMFKQR
jgi:hypothetical protein